MRRDVAVGDLPHNDEAEISVIGALFLDDDGVAFDEVSQIISASDFYHPAHRLIYEAIEALVVRGIGTDPRTVREELRERSRIEDAGGSEYLAKIFDVVPTTANAAYFARLVRYYSVRREMVRAGAEIVERGLDPREDDVEGEIDACERLVYSLADDRRVGAGPVDASKVLPEVFESMSRADAAALSTGLYRLDEKLLGGLRPGDLCVIAGRPSMGKTALALGIAASAAYERAERVLVFSVEMDRPEIIKRLLAYRGGLPLSAIVRGRTDWLSDGEMRDLDRATKEVRETESTLFLDDESVLTVHTLRSRARRVQSRTGLDLIVVDYLQLMSGTGDNRTQEISFITRGLKLVAKELGVPMVLLSQLSRGPEARSDKRPMLSDLRESGSIEQDADQVLLLFREAYYNESEAKREGRANVAEIIIAKQRNGPTGTVEIRWNGRSTRFENGDPLAPIQRSAFESEREEEVGEPIF